MTEILSASQRSEITRKNFLELVSGLFESKASTEEERDVWLECFLKLSPHPSGSDLIYWPAEGADNSPEGIVAEIECYCQENGLPGFKDSDF